MYHNLNVKAESLETPGLTSVATHRFFVNCVPRITVQPVEKRFVLGETSVTVFNVTIWNPLDPAVFTLEMKAQRSDGLPIPWVVFVCGANCTVPLGSTTGPTAVMLNIDKISAVSVPVFMFTAAKTGVYPITFSATTGPEKYQASGVLQIFAEGLDELGVWQLIAIIIIAGSFWYLLKNSKSLGKQKAQRRSRKKSPKKRRR